MKLELLLLATSAIVVMLNAEDGKNQSVVIGFMGALIGALSILLQERRIRDFWVIHKLRDEIWDLTKKRVDRGVA